MVGRTILQYKIAEKLGEGGMGVVYKAEDTQLRRTVALKFLPRETLDEEEVKARLIREAQAAAGLDHPNICQVFGIHEEDGEIFIAMAYIDGPSLADKIKERPLPLDEALGIASQIAEALHEAHEQGVVHRDIKPQTILLTSKGQVKVLDFGLASLTGRSKLTKTGTTLGTPAYMSPEQLEGKKVDRRADVWALGCVLYEMLTQRTPFDADYEQAIGYGILNEEPEPISAQRADVAPEADRLIGKALAKDPAERYQHADDLLADLRVLQKEARQKPASGRSRTAASTAISTAQAERSRMSRLPWLVAGACASVALTMGILYFSQPPAQLPALKTHILPPEGTSFFGLLSPAALSPDGRRIAFAAYKDNQPRLWIRDLDSLTARAVPASEGARFPFWSPDSQSVGFFAGSDLKRVEAAGGPVQTVAAGVVVNANPRGASWSGEDLIMLSGFVAAPLSAVPAAGGPVEQVTTLDDSSGETSTVGHSSCQMAVTTSTRH